MEIVGGKYILGLRVKKSVSKNTESFEGIIFVNPWERKTKYEKQSKYNRNFIKLITKEMKF